MHSHERPEQDRDDLPAPGDALPGSAQWVRRVLAAGWGEPWAGLPVRPFSADGAAPLTHTAGLWHVDLPGNSHVLKVQLNPDAARQRRFYPLKERIAAHCRNLGVPVPEAVPALNGATSVWCQGLVCELNPRLDGSSAVWFTAAQAQQVVRAGLDLRTALDQLPSPVARELARIPLPRLVEEEHWPTALKDAEERLLPLAEQGEDDWHRAAATALRETVAGGHLLRHTGVPAVGEPVARPAVVHSDLHYHHFLLTDDGPTGEPRVRGVLDFDNVHLGDRLLDLAWLAEAAGRVADPDRRRRSLAAFRGAATARGLLRPGEERLLMPLLMAHALPVIVDIAKDILERNILSPVWLGYFDLLSPARRLEIHHLLTAPDASAPASCRASGPSPYEI
ncbi:aminoglycoside phosphotransferase family protein [Streptomyces sp. NPDC041068]|uniref:aminoglycoside phosphotransferase family protein n=1 Tax=Streptomyces sp. NPDC041068 TaxID=3155130 RepID=UPI0033F5F074